LERNATFLLQGVLIPAEQRGNGVNAPDEFNLEAGKMNAGTEAFGDNMLEARAGGRSMGEPSTGDALDYNEQVQKAIEGFRAADALLAEWEAKAASRVTAE
jgi:hypothetical protein